MIPVYEVRALMGPWWRVMIVPLQNGSKPFDQRGKRSSFEKVYANQDMDRHEKGSRLMRDGFFIRSFAWFPIFAIDLYIINNVRKTQVHQCTIQGAKFANTYLFLLILRTIFGAFRFDTRFACLRWKVFHVHAHGSLTNSCNLSKDQNFKNVKLELQNVEGLTTSYIDVWLASDGSLSGTCWNKNGGIM